jgi:putative solute:sodium symporter small subunit
LGALRPFALTVSDLRRACNSRRFADSEKNRFVVSFGFGILFVEPLNRIPFFGFKLGFWWAQQGAIFVFVVLIFVYSRLMKRIDRRYGVHDDED